MSRRVAITAVELAAAMAAAGYVFVAMAQTPDHPAVRAGDLAVSTLLTFAAVVVALGLYAAVERGFPRLLVWLRRRAVRRAVRQLARDRMRRMQRRHAAPIGGVR